MMRRATPRSLLLLDEPTSGTYDLKKDAQGKEHLKALIDFGFETWIVTHHLELAKIGDKYPPVKCLMTEVEGGKPTYRLKDGIFRPTQETVCVDYVPDTGQKALAEGGHQDHITRLRALLEQGLIPEKRRAQYNAVMKSLE